MEYFTASANHYSFSETKVYWMNFSSVSFLVTRQKPKSIAVGSIKNVIIKKSVKIKSPIPNTTLEATRILCTIPRNT